MTSKNRFLQFLNTKCAHMYHVHFYSDNIIKTVFTTKMTSMTTWLIPFIQYHNGIKTKHLSNKNILETAIHLYCKKPSIRV